MEKFKNILIAIGIIAIFLTVVIIVIGVKLVSRVFLYTAGMIVLVVIIGIIIYYIRKFFHRSNDWTHAPVDRFRRLIYGTAPIRAGDINWTRPESGYVDIKFGQWTTLKQSPEVSI